MVNIRDAVASEGKYIKASDLQGRDWPLTISGVQQEDVSGQNDAAEMKWVVYFQGGQKGLVLNVTNATTIADQHGDETNTWAGRQITLFPTQTDFGGKQVPCIRVRLQQQQNFQAPPQQPTQPAGPAPSQSGYPDPTNVAANPNQGGQPFDDDLNDRVPF